MHTDFNRIITLLRKEKGITQKAASIELGVSQALLSHYEKGIRECGLEFVVKVADYYGVSCDYLLGRSPDRQGTTLSNEDIPDGTLLKENMTTGRASIIPILNKKLICNALNILFDMLSKSNNKGLIKEVSTYLMLSVYKMFRIIYQSHDKNQDTMFSLNTHLYKNYTEASMAVCEGKITAILNKVPVDDYDYIKDTSVFKMDTQSLVSDYPAFSSSLLNLVQNAENASNLK